MIHFWTHQRSTKAMTMLMGSSIKLCIAKRAIAGKDIFPVLGQEENEKRGGADCVVCGAKKCNWATEEKKAIITEKRCGDFFATPNRFNFDREHF